MRLYVLFALSFYACFSFPTKPKLTLDEFFDSTMFTYLSYSPTGQYLLIKTVRASWNTSSYEHSLWLYHTQQRRRTLITKNPHPSIKPQWSPSGQWLMLALDETPPDMMNSNPYRRSPPTDYPELEQHIYLYSLVSNDLVPIQIGTDIPLAFAWSDNDFSLYLATMNPQLAKKDEEGEWRDVIQYRDLQKQEQSILYRININQSHSFLSTKKNLIRHVPFFLNELLFIPFGRKLLCTSVSPLIENLQYFEIYSIDLQKASSSLVRLTDNEVIEGNLQLSIDGTHILFQSTSLGSNRRNFTDTQTRLHSLNLRTGQITRLAKNFQGNINEYKIRYDGDVYILGQLGTEIQIYLQGSLSDGLISLMGWNGTYESITLSSQDDSLAFVHSSTDKPMEVYLVDDIKQLQSAKPITNENKLFIQRDLPRAEVYRWRNEEDQQVIEGMLHYPPGKFEAKNLPLLVLIHGGPYAASVNRLLPDWYTWAPLAASEGWLVLEPNYRGSTGYGDQFLNEIRYRPLSLPGKDILFGVDQLIRDGIVDPYRLTVGGYSYGGFLTNWLITQTKRFNAALSGAGAIDHLSAWGTMDLPVLLSYIFGGYPWDVSHIYQNEAPIYQLDRVRTPTLISTGENDIRVPTSQSYIFERALSYRGVPVKLIMFPGEGHELLIDPWHGKIKVREELKWLKKYDHQRSKTYVL